VSVNGFQQPQWRFNGIEIKDGHVVTVARGPPQDVVDALGAFSGTCVGPLFSKRRRFAKCCCFTNAAAATSFAQVFQAAPFRPRLCGGGAEIRRSRHSRSGTVRFVLLKVVVFEKPPPTGTLRA
jgi:hypothetical protein